MPENDEAPAHGPRSFWSGTLTFGLVSIPVDLFTANRSGRADLRMLAADGTPLRRVYYCPREEKIIDSDEIVRGYEVDEDRYIVITDEELEAVEPEKSRDIHLRQFVPIAALPPAHYLRGYYLAPSGQSTRAYAVLAQTMEQTGQAGIATFVMRGSEYVIAIVAADGVLRAQTLRFVDELRSPKDIGLPAFEKPSAAAVKRMKKAISDLAADEIPLDPFHDERAEGIRELARAKLERGEDVIETAVPSEEEAAEEGFQPPDLIALLKKRLREAAPSERSKSELLEEARALGIEGRSKMSKEDLVEAIERARAA